MWYGLVRFSKMNPKSSPIRAVFTKKIQIHPIIFGFFNWFGFEHHYKIVWFKNTEENLRYLEMRESFTV
jgi:hypothetical protein